MNDLLKNAMRKEAFVQGWLHAAARATNRKLHEVPDKQLLEWCITADVDYRELATKRGWPQ